MAFKFPFTLKNEYLFDIAVYDTKGESPNYIDFKTQKPDAIIKKGDTFFSKTMTITSDSHELIDIGSYHNLLLRVAGIGEIFVYHADAADFGELSGNRAVVIDYTSQRLLIKYEISDEMEASGLVPATPMSIDRFGCLTVKAYDSAMKRVATRLNKSLIQ